MMMIYKQVQLILCYYNQSHQDIFVVVALNLVGVCFVIGLFATISSWKVMPNMQFFVLTVSALQLAFGLMVCCGFFLGVYDDSIGFIASL